MNEENKINASVVNDPQQPSKIRAGTPASSMPTPLQVDTDEAGSQQKQLLNLSFKRDPNTRITSNTRKTNVSSPGNTDVPANLMCNMCKRNDDVCVNLQNNHVTVLTVSDITRLPSWNIRQILSAVCSRCLVYIGTIAETSSKLRLRCEQAMHRQSGVVAPPTPDTSPNLLDDATDRSNNVQQQRNCYGPDYCDDTANDISLSLATSSSPAPPPLAKKIFDDISRSPSPSVPGNDSMLRIHHERPVSPLNTESGGGGKNSKRSYQRVQKIPVQMICSHCNRAYWRKDYYRKHMRRCSAKYRYAKSLMPTRSRSASRLELDAVSVLSEGNEEITIHRQPRKFRCNMCSVTVENISILRQHKRLHLRLLYCDICSSDFISKIEYDFHRVLCMAKKEVFEKGLEDIRNGVPMATRRRTRSFSRAQSVAPSLASSITEKTKKVKTHAKKSKKCASVISPKKQVSEQIQNVDVQSTITNYVKRHKHLYTDVTSEENNEAGDEDNNEAGDEDNEEDDDDDVSQVDTLYSNRMYLTNHWVEEHSISSQSYLSQGDYYINSYMRDIPFRTFKEYDLYLLDHLKNEVSLKSLTCFVPDCGFTCKTLNNMMLHDYWDHYKYPWFYCHKCGYCFTSKVFLDYHLDLQNKGRYVCYKCGGHFNYQHQLDSHLIQHNKLSRDGGESYVCQFCNFEFLDQADLLEHCRYENHDFNVKKHSIEIDHSMTITNKVPAKMNEGRKNKIYKVKILNMTLKPMPTKRCTPMEKYRPDLPEHLQELTYGSIGLVEFRYPLNPNCVGCL